MSSVSATHLILFIASLVLAVGIAGTLVVEVGQLSDVIDDRSSNVAAEIETDVAIISDEGSPDAIYGENEEGNDEITILVKNLGSRSLDIDERNIDVLIDGTYISNDRIDDVSRVDVEGSNRWRPGGVIEITVNPEKDVSGDTSLTVIVDGAEDSIRVHIPETT
ncbi:flagellin [Natrarchaeobius sp. A-rgal3]|uniref:flagellin n=1 Tax=Natrarchaeobius versutus TaxID=1679078 RepID=UPI00350F1D19